MILFRCIGLNTYIEYRPEGHPPWRFADLAEQCPDCGGDEYSLVTKDGKPHTLKCKNPRCESEWRLVR